MIQLVGPGQLRIIPEMEGNVRDIKSKGREAEMRNGLWFVVAQALMLSSCSPGTGEVVFQHPTVTRASIPVQAETPSSYALPPREAMVLEIENQVLAYTFSSQDPIPAVNGMRIQPSGGVETGADSRARLDLLPDGTIIRVGPHSTFVLVSLTHEGGENRTRLEFVI